MAGDRNTLQDLAVFVEVARHESFTRAAEHLGLSAATTSRRVGALEKECGARLFNRSTRRVELTRAGSRLLERCAPIIDEARQARESLREEMRRVAGTLRVSMPPDFGAVIAMPHLAEFAQLHPDVSFQLDLTPQFRDVLQDNFDLVLRMGAIKDEGLVSRRVALLEQCLCASPAYLRRHGTPSHPGELASHECIFIGGGSRRITWTFSSGNATAKVQVSGRFSANNQGLMRALAERDMGIALLEATLTAEALAAGRLVRLLPGWSAPRIPVQAVTTSRLQSALVKAFVNHLGERLRAARRA